MDVIVRLSHPRSGDSQGQETFLAPSADKQTHNYDTECSNHHPSLSTLKWWRWNVARWNGEPYIYIHWALWRTLMTTEYFLFVQCTTSIWAKLSTCCFEHSGNIICPLLINPNHTDESWEGRNTCLWIHTLWIYSLSTLENTDENRIFFVRSLHHKHLGKAQHLVLWALWWHQFSTR